MTLLRGTRPRHPGPARHRPTSRSTIDGRPCRVPAGTSVMRAAALAGIDIPKLCATDSPRGVRLLPAVPGRGRRAARARPRRARRRRADGMVVTTQTAAAGEAAPRRDGALHLRPPAGLPDLPGQRRLRAAGHGRRRSGCARSATAATARTTSTPRHGRLSNPYFAFDPAKCIVCSRCVRACDEIQGTFALTIEGRGFDSKVSRRRRRVFMDSECVSCGACVQACPTVDAAGEVGRRARHADPLGRSPPAPTAASAARSRPRCAGDEVVRMVPSKDGGANEGHSLRQGPVRLRLRHPPGPRARPDGARHDHRRVARGLVGRGDRLRRAAAAREIQAEHGVGAIGGITSSRCTNEEVYVVQKMVRAAFGNNNVDTCARVCHSPTGYGLKQTFGTSAGTQDFRRSTRPTSSCVIGANPTDAHPVFASRMKRRLRAGRPADRRRPAPDRPGAQPAHRGRTTTCQLQPGHQRRRRQRDGPRRRHRGPGRPRRSSRSAARTTSTSGPSSSPARRTAPRRSSRGHRRARRRAARGRPALRHRAATPRSTTASASPSTARARRW